MLSNQRLPDGVYIQTINTTSINSITPKRNVNGFIALYYFKILLPQKANPTENKIPTMNIPIILISIFSDWNNIAIPPSTNAVTGKHTLISLENQALFTQNPPLYPHSPDLAPLRPR